MPFLLIDSSTKHIKTKTLYQSKEMNTWFSNPTTWFQGSKQTKNKVGFEDVLRCIKGNSGLVISTLPFEKQGCLIRGALTIEQEVVELNDLLEGGDFQEEIIVYGLNHTDDTVLKKQGQLIGMGFQNVRVYLGGLFEWLLLQDVYGKEQFPTTNTTTVDILSYFVGKK